MATSNKGKSGATGTSTAKAKAKDAPEQQDTDKDAPETTPDATPTGPADPDQPNTDGDAEGGEPRIGAALTGAPHAAAAAMTPPNNEAAKATWPVMGRLDSSNNPVDANAALRSPSGSTHKRLVDDQGAAVDLDDVFTFPASGSASTVATVTKRIYEEFRYPNTNTVTTHLMWPAGAVVPIPEALRVKNTYQYAPSDEIPDGT